MIYLPNVRIPCLDDHTPYIPCAIMCLKMEYTPPMAELNMWNFRTGSQGSLRSRTWFQRTSGGTLRAPGPQNCFHWETHLPKNGAMNHTLVDWLL
jgi:hypothetical protein